MEPGEALTTAAQIAVALAGFAGVVVAFRSKSLHEWSPRDKFRLWLLLGNALVPLFDTTLHLELVQRVLAPFEFSFWFLSWRRMSELGRTVIKDMGVYRYFFGWRPGDSGDSVAVLQCSSLGRFLALLCRRHFSTGHRHCAICSDDSSAAASERDLDSPNGAAGMRAR